MKISLKPTDPLKFEVDLLIYCTWQDGFLHEIDSLPKELALVLKEGIKKENFTAGEDQNIVVTTRGMVNPYKIALLGLGKKSEFDQRDFHEAIARAFRLALGIKTVKVGLVIKDEWSNKFGNGETVQTIVEAARLSVYHFDKYKSEEEQRKSREIEEVLLYLPASRLEAGDGGVKTGMIYSEAVIIARDLVNEPPAVTTPTFLAETAQNIAKQAKGEIKISILEQEDAKRLGMNAFLGVSQGSDQPPKFIIMRYKPSRSKRKIAVIGKGITFDTGGLSLKSSQSMEQMKLDMSGAAVVLAIFTVLPLLKPSVEVVGIVAACENMPSGKAIKPGDILKAANGKTIEVLNTDAEGRLILADAISYVRKKEKPDEIIDLATLTGACIVALGEEIAGLWGNNEKLLTAIENSAQKTGEKIWRMPLEKKYKELIKSHIADVKNIQTGKYGGAITAALFLSEFVDDTPWVHLDIAGPAYMEKDSPLIPKGGAGFGVRLLLHYLSSI